MLSQFCFGNPCLACHKVTQPSLAIPGLCRHCLSQLPWRLADSKLPWPPELTAAFTNQAIRNTIAHSDILVACRYDTPIREGLLALKFSDASEWSQTFAALLAALIARDTVHFDAIVAVPLHPKRLAERGYNQAGLIAAALATRLAVPDWSSQLIRARDTARQSEQKMRSDRYLNLEQAFRWQGNRNLQLARILLVDDVLTTGATLGAAAAPLFALGAVVTGLAVASDHKVPNIPYW
ncbi:MAG: histidine phosphatase family protein [Eubacteriales bacterium]|nr:histidine phosphatase family protein [Eubacteriales bacterium]